MRLFYAKYEKCQPLASKLSWSYYCYLIYIEDEIGEAYDKEWELKDEYMRNGRIESIEQTTKNSLSMKMKIEDISKTTGLSIEQMESLK